MSNIRMVESTLPPGFRFHPTDEELLCDYLMNKVLNSQSFLLIEVNLNESEPWDIPDTACVGGREYYFYSQRDRKYATGVRTNRATGRGYWKATGKDRSVLRKGSLVGMRKTLVFYEGRAPKGKKTSWVMHEFRLEGPFTVFTPPLKEDWVLCRVFNKEKERSGHLRTGSSSTSLPPLMDSYINFDQTQNNDDHHDHPYHQPYLHDTDQLPVSCFSILSETQDLTTNPILMNLTHFKGPRTPNGNPTEKSPIMDDLKVMLNQLTRMDGSFDVKRSAKFGEGSSKSYLDHEIGMHNDWDY